MSTEQNESNAGTPSPERIGYTSCGNCPLKLFADFRERERGLGAMGVMGGAGRLLTSYLLLFTWEPT